MTNFVVFVALIFVVCLLIILVKKNKDFLIKEFKYHNNFLPKFYIFEKKMFKYSFYSNILTVLSLKISNFFSNWVLSTNHRRIAIMYFLFTIISGFTGLVLATVIRIELAYPGQSILVNNAEKYLTVISLHGIIMVFFMIIPIIFGAFGNFLLPTQLGIRDVAFPRLNSFMFWVTPSGFVMLLHIILFDKSYNLTYWINYSELKFQLRRRYFFSREQFFTYTQYSDDSLLALRFKKLNSTSDVQDYLLYDNINSLSNGSGSRFKIKSDTTFLTYNLFANLPNRAVFVYNSAVQAFSSIKSLMSSFMNNFLVFFTFGVYKKLTCAFCSLTTSISMSLLLSYSIFVDYAQNIKDSTLFFFLMFESLIICTFNLHLNYTVTAGLIFSNIEILFVCLNNTLSYFIESLAVTLRIVQFFLFNTSLFSLAPQDFFIAVSSIFIKFNDCLHFCYRYCLVKITGVVYSQFSFNLLLTGMFEAVVSFYLFLLLAWCSIISVYLDFINFVIHQSDACSVIYIKLKNNVGFVLFTYLSLRCYGLALFYKNLNSAYAWSTHSIFNAVSLNFIFLKYCFFLYSSDFYQTSVLHLSLLYFSASLNFYKNMFYFKTSVHTLFNVIFSLTGSLLSVIYQCFVSIVPNLIAAASHMLNNLSLVYLQDLLNSALISLFSNFAYIQHFAAVRVYVSLINNYAVLCAILDYLLFIARMPYLLLLDVYVQKSIRGVLRFNFFYDYSGFYAKKDNSNFFNNASVHYLDSLSIVYHNNIFFNISWLNNNFMHNFYYDVSDLSNNKNSEKELSFLYSNLYLLNNEYSKHFNSITTLNSDYSLKTLSNGLDYIFIDNFSFYNFFKNFYIYGFSYLCSPLCAKFTTVWSNFYSHKTSVPCYAKDTVIQGLPKVIADDFAFLILYLKRTALFVEFFNFLIISSLAVTHLAATSLFDLHTSLIINYRMFNYVVVTYSFLFNSVLSYFYLIAHDCFFHVTFLFLIFDFKHTKSKVSTLNMISFDPQYHLTNFSILGLTQDILNNVSCSLSDNFNNLVSASLDYSYLNAVYPDLMLSRYNLILNSPCLNIYVLDYLNLNDVKPVFFYDYPLFKSCVQGCIGNALLPANYNYICLREYVLNLNNNYNIMSIIINRGMIVIDKTQFFNENFLNSLVFNNKTRSFNIVDGNININKVNEFFFNNLLLKNYYLMHSTAQKQYMISFKNLQLFSNFYVKLLLNMDYFLDWKELRLEREIWRSIDDLSLARRHWLLRKKYYANFYEPETLINKVSIWFPNHLIPGWAFVTPYTSRLRYTALGKVDIALVVILMASVGSTFSSINYVITYRYIGSPIFKNRKELRSFFIDALLVSSRMMILANPALIIGIILLLSDRHFGTSVFDFSGGGDTILFQHLFWFFGHPEVYIIIIPCFGFMNSLLPYYLKKRLSGRLSLQFSIYTIAFMGFAVWGHHMYMVGLANSVRTLYSTMTIMISVPASTKVLHWCVTIINSTISCDVGFLFLLSFMYFFVLGGLSGMFLAHIGFDVIFHDTFYVIGHFHVLLAGAAMSCVFAAFYFYFPAIFGVKYSRMYAYLHFFFYTSGQILTLVPMFWLGYAGMPRRIMDYPSIFGGWHSIISSGHILTFVSLIFFLLMIFDSLYESRSPLSKTKGVSRLNTRLSLYVYEIRKLKFYKNKILSNNNSYPNCNKLQNKNLSRLELTNFEYMFKS